MPLPNEPIYPASAPPTDPGQARLLGLYDQRQEGLLMQRLKLYGGRLSLDQWKAVLELAERLTPDYALRLTTRQDIEFHGLKREQIPELQSGLSEAGVTTVGACGDTLRNITECSGCDGLDGAPLAERLRQELGALDCLFTLPRKFKISISGCAGACAKPWINDLGLVANADGTFAAILAGSLGARPGTGLLCYEALSPDEVVALAIAAVKLHNAESDRENRRRARLRHVRERLGDQAFKQRLHEFFTDEKKVERRRFPPLERRELDGNPLRLAMPHGELRGDWLRSLLDLLVPAGGSLTAGLEHDLFVHGIAADDLPKELRAMVGAPRIVACPGAHLCERGLVETWPVADAIRAALPPVCDLTVALSGCPNNCSHPAVADIGFVGRVKKVAGKPQPHFRLLAGGGRGENPKLAEELDPALPAERAAVAAARRARNILFQEDA
jgi:sulfite reductase beta subunit-like hemoprotein